MSKQHILFLTGRLAEKRLRRILEAMQSRVFTYEIVNIGVECGCLNDRRYDQTPIANAREADRVIIPGFVAVIWMPSVRTSRYLLFVALLISKIYRPFSEKTSELPDLSAHDVLIFAEIVEAPELQMPEIMQAGLRNIERPALM